MPAVKPVLLIAAVTMRVQKVWLPIEAYPLVGRGEDENNMMVDGGTIYGLENIEKRKEKYTLVDHDIVVDVDVCVIGSGAAGAILGEKLAKGGIDGRSVVILEKGGYYYAEDMNQREVDMIPLLWKNGCVV